MQQTPNQKDALDFWVGSWDVYAEGQLNGHDVVEKTMDGEGVIERWKGVEKGDEGMSLFYFRPFINSWKQVWIVPSGGYKEKESAPVPGGIRFSGHVYGPKGRVLADRTTLTLNADGTVHQVIEQSKDEGKTWVVGFDAIYKKSKS